MFSKDDGFVEFNCLRLNSFGLASTPKMTEGVVDPSGKILSTGNDGRSNTVFIEGCVTSKQKYQYSVNILNISNEFYFTLFQSCEE